MLPKTLDVLGALIRKIKKETDADTELLLVDDGSREDVYTRQLLSSSPSFFIVLSAWLIV